MQQNSFPWDENEVVKAAYKNKNYEVVYTGSKTGRAIVFFSGNGLYYPNTEEEFRNKVLDNNRYEWENLSKSASKKMLFRYLWK